jgi:hypothetical protein
MIKNNWYRLVVVVVVSGLRNSRLDSFTFWLFDHDIIKSFTVPSVSNCCNRSAHEEPVTALSVLTRSLLEERIVM